MRENLVNYSSCILLCLVFVVCEDTTQRWRGYRRGSGLASATGRYGTYTYRSRWSSYSGSYTYAPGQYRRAFSPGSKWRSWKGYTRKYAQSGAWARRYQRVGITTTTKEYESSSSSEVSLKETVKRYNRIPIFYNRDTIMDVFDVERKSYEDLVLDMMANYEHICLALPDVPTPLPMKRKPFIVIEGNHKPSRKKLAESLAQRLAGKPLNFPRKCLQQFVHKFPNGTKLRRAFLGLALYASEYKVRQLWDKSIAAVMDGYWLDQTSEMIAWMFGSRNLTLPPANHRVYSWPEDLMQPDIIFYLKVPDSYVPPVKFKWMSLIPEVYRKIKSPKVVIVVPKGGANKTAETIHRYINEYLNGKCDLSCTTPWPETEENMYDRLY